MKLNVGCGYNKIQGYINIDLHPPNKPDLLADIRGALPFDDNSVDEILMFHTIEHIEEKWHPILLNEFWRVLRPSALLMFSYPEFKKCAQNYIDNYKGQRNFWKNTIYGLQRFPGDYHVTLMDTESFIEVLQEHGFENIRYKAESQEFYNTILVCYKGRKPMSYEECLNEFIFQRRN